MRVGKAARRTGSSAFAAAPPAGAIADLPRMVEPLLDAVVDFLPSPLEIPPMEGANPDNPEEKTAPIESRRIIRYRIGITKD